VSEGIGNYGQASMRVDACKDSDSDRDRDRNLARRVVLFVIHH